jgi:hypothetical protein
MLAAFLLISCAGVSQPQENTSTATHAPSPWVSFAGSKSYTAMNLDSGKVFKRDFIKGLLPYVIAECPRSLKLLSYIGWDLSCGCVLIDSGGMLTASFPGYSMRKLNGDALLGVRVNDVLEGVPGESTVALIKLVPELQSAELANTLPLPPVGMLLSGDSAKLAEPMLLATYTPLEAVHDVNYPWAQDLTFTAVDDNAGVLWTSSVTTRKLVADLELVGNCGGVMLVSARYGYADGEYIGLDASTGELLWHVTSTIIMLAQDDYPYTDYIYKLPLEVSGNTAWVPAYDSRYEEPGKCKIDLRTGASWLDVDKEWVKRANEEWKKRQLPAETPRTEEWKLDAGQVLKLGNGKLVMTSRGVKIWERKLAPHFGAGLKLQQAGQKLLLLVETSAAVGGVGSQGLAHIIDRSTGEEPLPELEENAQYFQPLLIGGKVLLLDKEKTRLIQPPS